MDVKEYIASGTLELYVAGVLPPEEREEVAKLASLHPEIKAEIRKIEEVMEGYSQLHSRKPGSELGNKVLEAIEKAGEPADTYPQDTPVIIRTIHTSTSAAFKYLAAASIVLLLAGNILFVSKWRSAEEQLESLIAQNYQLAENYRQVREDYTRADNDLKIAVNPGFRQIALKGLPIAPDASALVYWNDQTRETYINAQALPFPPPDKQYQLWALVDGKPVDAGVFEVSSGLSGMQKVKRVEKAQAFAVTLEARGGSPSPTMDQMYAMAKI